MICESVSLDFEASKKGMSADLDMNSESETERTPVTKRSRSERPENNRNELRYDANLRYEPRRESRSESRDYDDNQRHGKNKNNWEIKKSRNFMGRKSDRRSRDDDDDNDSLWNCDDLSCTVEWVMQYVLDTLTYPIRRLAD